MQIFVDADACPVVDIVETIAEKYNISTTSLLWHLGNGSQGPVDLGLEPTEAERRHMLFTNQASGTRMRT